ncbi:MAG TPA: efflux RND transporter permease subunit [Candidatus Atribacteria bacterium]|nr:efflux RND transporter permease subunit [Candidatus Atribacteria bacterium]
MNLPNFSVSRPVTILMLFIGLILIGLISYQNLGLDLLPDLSFPMSAIIVSYSGVAPQEIENMITIPLEEAVGTIQGVKKISSYSREGNSLVLMEFNWGTDMDVSAMNIREKIDQIKGFLPDDASDPMVIKFDPALMPILVLGMGSEERDLQKLQKYAEDIIKPRLERMEEVASVSINGGLDREILVSIDNDKLRSNQLSFSQVTAALAGENVNLPAGTLKEGTINFLIRTLGRFESTQDIEKILISNIRGNKIYLGDIAKVEDTFKERNSITYVNGKPGIMISLQKESGKNTVTVAKRVFKELETIQKLLPEDISITPVFDSSDFIEKTISQVGWVALYGAIIAVFVLFFFLGNLGSTLIIGFAIPISLIFTFTLLYFSHLTLNMMTLGGLALGIGMMVDNSIVVLENIFRYRESRTGIKESACLGASEVSTAISASTFTTIAVFLPIVYVQGIASELFRPMGYTITFSLLTSLLVALTLVPMLSSKIMHFKVQDNNSSISKENIVQNSLSQSGRIFNFVKEEYSRLLSWSLRHRGSVFILAVLIFAGSIMLIPFVGTEFIPSSDQGQFNINITLPTGTNLETTREVVSKVEKIVLEIPEMKSILTTAGEGSGGMGFSTEGGNSGTIMVNLVEQNKRDRSTAQIINQLREKIGTYPDAKIKFSEQSMSFSSGSDLEVKISGDSLDELENIANRILVSLEEVEGVYDLESSVEDVRPELHVNIDREKANLYGLNTVHIASTVHDALLGRVASIYQEKGEQVDIRIRLEEEDRNSIEEVKNLLISSNTGLQIPLKEIAEVIVGSGPKGIDRENQQRIVNVSGNISDRFLGKVIQDAQKQLEKLVLPEDYHYEFVGQNREMQESFLQLGLALVLSIILVYMIIAAQFESLLMPLAVMFSVPFSLIGVILGLLLADKSLNVLSYIGIIMLVGIVVNNSIVLIDYINKLRQKGIERKEAIILGGTTRLRPILMTMFTTVLALVPMALGIGEGAELRAPMAITIIGGLTSSTFLSLIIVPIFYTFLDDLSQKITGRGRAKN